MEHFTIRLINGLVSKKESSNKTALLPIAIKRYYKEILFDIIRMVIYYIILGIP